jgi:hypothetical protein
MVSYIKKGMQAKNIWKQNPEANIYAQGAPSKHVDSSSICWIYRPDQTIALNRIIISRAI